MALSNAERQARWRAKRNALAKKAAGFQVDPSASPEERIKEANAYWESVRDDLMEATKVLAREYAAAAKQHKTTKDFRGWLMERDLDLFNGRPLDALVTLGDEAGDLVEDLVATAITDIKLPLLLLDEWNSDRRKALRRK